MIRTGKAGSGTYGIVYKAKILADNRNVAVKRNIVDESVSFSGSIKELDLLTRLKNHPYIVKLLSVSFVNPLSTPNSPIGKIGGFSYREDYLHFIFEQASNNGHDLIFSAEDTPVNNLLPISNFGNSLSGSLSMGTLSAGNYEKKYLIHMSYLKLAMVQLFLGIEYMHGQQVIHRDIKPSNLLWFISPDNKSAAIKICDFGLAKVNNSYEPMTPKVVTCWYRAPEICAHDPNYSFASDIWSAGCTIFEMIAKKALLANAPDDDVKILSKIIGLVPDVSSEDIYKLTKGYKIKLTPEASPRYRASFKDLINLTPARLEEFNQYPEEGAKYDTFLDLLKNLLTLNPDKRLTATQALTHPFFEPYQEIIKSIRKEYPPVPPVSENINIICCHERAWACKAAFLVFNNRSYLKWYKHKILFQSIDMFDRYITYIRLKTFTRLVPSKYQGRYLTRYQTELYYIVCLYMCIKYFTTLHIPISYGELATDIYKTPKALIEAEEFEKKMLGEVLHSCIYRETVYDVLSQTEKGIPDEFKTRDLLDRYGNIGNDVNINLTDLYKLCTSTNNDHGVQQVLGSVK